MQIVHSWNFPLNILKPVEQKSSMLQNVKLEMTGNSVIVSAFPCCHFPVSAGYLHSILLLITNDSKFVCCLFFWCVEMESLTARWSETHYSWGWPWAGPFAPISKVLRFLSRVLPPGPTGWRFAFEYKILKGVKQLLSDCGYINILLLNHIF